MNIFVLYICTFVTILRPLYAIDDSSNIYDFFVNKTNLHGYFKKEASFWNSFDNILFVSEGVSKSRDRRENSFSMAKALTLIGGHTHIYASDLDCDLSYHKHPNFHYIEQNNHKDFLPEYVNFFDAIILIRGLCLCNSFHDPKISCSAIDITDRKQLTAFFSRLVKVLKHQNGNFIYLNGPLFKRNQLPNKKASIKRKHVIPTALREIQKSVNDIIDQNKNLQGRVLFDETYFISHLIQSKLFSKVERKLTNKLDLTTINSIVELVLQDFQAKKIKENELIENYITTKLATQLTKKMGVPKNEQLAISNYVQSALRTVFRHSYGDIKTAPNEQFYIYKAYDFYGVFFQISIDP